MLPSRTVVVSRCATAINKEDFLTALPHPVSLARPTGRQAAAIRAADLLQAMVAAYALLAHADGEAASAERRRMLMILRENRALSVFSREDLVREMAEHEANYRYDPEVAQEIAREKLALANGQPKAALQIVEACRDLISADGIAHPAEYRALASITALLGVDVTTAAFDPARHQASSQ